MLTPTKSTDEIYVMKRDKVIAETPLVAQTICSCCSRGAIATGRDGKPYCHLCRDWKADRLARCDEQRMGLKTTQTALGYFDPDSIRQLGDRDLPACLRALADTIAVGHVDGRLLSLHGNVFNKPTDRRVHVVLSIDLATEVRRELTV